MAKVKRDVVVTAIRDISPHMRRISLGGDSLKSFPEGQESAYIKFVFPPKDEGGRQRLRSYTVRHFDAKELRLDVDFALHSVGGPATAWAQSCAVGDAITIVGPGPTKLVDPTADWFFLVGDMTALPAIAANLEKLPADATGIAGVEISHDSDKLSLEKPAGVDLRWVVSSEDGQGRELIDAVRAQPWREGTVGVWSACEFGKMKLLRAHFHDERAAPPETTYISSYWKLRATDEEHKKAKSEDA